MVVLDPELVLIEDNPHDVEITLRVFQEHLDVDRVLVVQNGEDAVRYVDEIEERHQNRAGGLLPKLILLDIKLPLINGIEVLERLKKSEILKSVPVVMLTSSREERDIEDCYDHGANSYLVKPINYNDFKMLSSLLSPYWMKLNKVPYIAS